MKVAFNKSKSLVVLAVIIAVAGMVSCRSSRTAANAMQRARVMGIESSCPYKPLFFNNDGLKTMLKNIAKCYDVEVKYEGKFKDRRHLLYLSGCDSLESILEFLGRQLEMSISLKDKTIIVKP